jgi:hypothetical protein
LLWLLVCTDASADAPRIESPDPGQSTVVSDERDWDGLMRDTRYFVGYQAVSIAILYTMPESVSGWTDEQKDDYSLDVWWDNVTHPQWDSDDFYLNYVLHPYWGAAYFVRARERGYDEWQSFGYSVLLSSIYEFGIEALFEEPSIQDIFVTPIAGSLLGRYFWRVRGNIRARDADRGFRSTGDKWIWVLTDPLGGMNRLTDRLTGRETRWQLRPMRAAPARLLTALSGRPPQRQASVYGFEIEVCWE